MFFIIKIFYTLGLLLFFQNFVHSFSPGKFVKRILSVESNNQGTIDKNVGNRKGLFDNEEVFLTLSSEVGFQVAGKNHILDRRLELNWNNFNVQPGDFVGLYDHSISQNNYNVSYRDSALELVSVKTSRGYFRTSIKFERKQKLSATMGEQCIDYWIAYGTVAPNGSTILLKTNCFRIYPSWMNNMREIIGDTPLHSLMIPGTHDAGAWKHYSSLDLENLITTYYICQEETIYDQLVHGIRYLDVRVAYYPDTAEKFWVNHGNFKVDPLIYLIADLKRFTMETKEIVFMDFHGFPVGFTDSSIHEDLVKYVDENIGSLLVPRSFSQNVTPNQIWAANKTVMFTYGNAGMTSKYDLLWPRVDQAWGNKDDVKDLENYLSAAISTKGCTGIFWSAMAELTPNAEDIIFRPNIGLREYSQLVNIDMTYWYHREPWFKKSMIVATDFFLGNNIIEIAVNANQNRAVCKQ